MRLLDLDRAGESLSRDEKGREEKEPGEE